MTSHSISPEGLALIQEFEGFSAEPVQLPDGNWVVGYGHVRIGDAGETINEREALDLLALDLAPVERSVNALTQTLSQSQFDALVSFAFSVGIDAFEQSQVVRRVNAGQPVAAACAMDAWRKSDVSGELEIIEALVRRRAAEKALFLKGAAHDASPSVFMRAKLDHAASILGAPIKYAPAPAVGSIPVAPVQPQAAARLTEILKSEPATEALLLTRVATEAEVQFEATEEITTAHAKPVARTIHDVRIAAQRAAQDQRSVKRFAFSFGNPVQAIGLGALLVFGLGLITLGGSALFTGAGDAVDLMGASALAGPGLAAALMAGFGLWRSPVLKRATI